MLSMGTDPIKSKSGAPDTNLITSSTSNTVFLNLPRYIKRGIFLLLPKNEQRNIAISCPHMLSIMYERDVLPENLIFRLNSCELHRKFLVVNTDRPVGPDGTRFESAKTYFTKIAPLLLSHNSREFKESVIASLKTVPHLKVLELHFSNSLEDSDVQSFLRSILSMSTLAELEQLTIHSNTLSALPNWLSRPKYFHMLKLACPELIELPDWLSQFDYLKTLDIEYGPKMVTFPSIMLSTLHTLRMSFMPSDFTPSTISFPEFISSLPELKVLDLERFYHFSELPNWIANLSDTIDTIKLNCLNLKPFPKAIEKLKGLHTLELSEGGSMTQLLSLVEKLPFLKKLILKSWQDFSQLSDIFIKMPSLTELIIESSAKFETAPAELSRLHNLCVLAVKKCENFQTFSPQINNLPNLRKLVIDDCESFESLSLNGAQLPLLEELILTENVNFKNLPTVGVNHVYFSYLTTLDISGSQSFDSLPDYLPQLPNLRVLKLKGGFLRDFPVVTDNYPSLRILDLSETPLETFSIIAGSLVNLEELDFSGCQSLMGIQDNIIHCSNLKSLSFKGCRNLTMLPSNFNMLNRLLTLDIRHCNQLDLSLLEMPPNLNIIRDE